MPIFSVQGQEDPMATLCRMVVQTTYADLPAAVTRKTKETILDTMAVTIGGCGMEGVPEVVEFVKDKAGKLESRIPFYGGRVPASEAAFAIGPMARAMDFGDVHGEAGHVSEYILATLLAAADLRGRVSGEEFIAAFALGQEVMIRIGIAYQLISKAIPLARDSGGHYIFGAVASAGKLLGLGQEELENAEGIARTMTYPHDMTMYSPATLMPRIHHAFVCQDAINACLLARKGITGPRRGVLAGPSSFLANHSWTVAPEALTQRLGEHWDLLDLIPKGFVSCLPTHTAAAGIIQQMAEHGFGPADIESIHVDVAAAGFNPCCHPHGEKWNPVSIPDCQFSLPYVVAVAAFEGEVSPESYSPEMRARQDIRELMARITATSDEKLPSWGARVTTTLTDKRRWARDCLHLKGMPQNPFTTDDYVRKFKMCVRSSTFKMSDDMSDGLIRDILALETVRDVGQALLGPITPL